MDDCTDLSLKILGKSINFISLLIKGIYFDEMSYMINFGINDWTKSMLSIIGLFYRKIY